MNWYALHVRSQYEKRVKLQLEYLRIEPFYPTYLQKSRWTDRTKTIERPLFPGYLFAHFEPEDCGRVQAIKGVAHVLGDGIDPIAVPDEQIEAVRTLLASPFELTPMSLIQVGKRVVIEHGALRGIEGWVVEIKKRCQVVVAIDLLRKGVGLQVDAQWLRAV